MAEDHWSKAANERFNAYREEIYKVVFVALKGVGALTNSDDPISDTTTLGDVANEMIDSEYASLHGLAVVGLWAALEAYVNDVVAHRLVDEPKWAIESSDIARMKTTVGDFMGMDEWERARFIVRGIRQSLGAGGLTAFEALFDAVGLPRQEELKKARDLEEMHQVRILLVHHSGIVTSHFVETCHWTNLKVGDRWTVNNDAFSRYNSAVHEFARGFYDRFIHDLKLKQEALEPKPPAT